MNVQSSIFTLRVLAALPKEWSGRKRQANTGSAGALARYEREARNSERAAHVPAGEGARAPTTNWLVPDRIDFLGKAGFSDRKIEL